MPSQTSSTQFQCTGFDCKMVFTRSEHLARHVRKHTGERPFVCHCGRAFSRLDNVRQHANTVHEDSVQKNAETLAALVDLHNALSVSTIFQQVAEGMVSGDILLKSPPKAKRKPAPPRMKLKPSPAATRKAALPSSPFRLERQAQPQFGVKPPHSQQHYEHHFEATIYGSSVYPQTQFIHHSPSPRTPRTPLYAHPSYPHSGSSHLSSPTSPTPHRRPRAYQPSPERYAPEPLSYGSPALTPPATPLQSPRVTLPPISQLLPSPFARGQTNGTVSTEEEPIYYAVAGEVDEYEQLAQKGYEMQEGTYFYEQEQAYSISSEESPHSATAELYSYPRSEPHSYTHYPSYLKPPEPFYDHPYSAPRSYSPLTPRTSFSRPTGGETYAILDPGFEDPRYAGNGGLMEAVAAGYGGKRREEWEEERGWKRRG